MPELPEVENMCLGLGKMLSDQPQVKRVKLMRKDIRFPIPKDLPKRLEGQTIKSIKRLAKYILFCTEEGALLSHLGMTGSWRLVKSGDEDKHDHCYIELVDGRCLAFRDPRRFGLLDWVKKGREKNHPRLMSLGVEPLLKAEFNDGFLFERSRKRQVAIKTFIMDQKIVVGIGNIYASEALFHAKVRPGRKAGKITRDEALRIVEESRRILLKAIKAGGSSIRDYRHADGESGSFQNSHAVYDRAGLPCVVCGETIKMRVITGRSTFWCSHCQV